MPYFVKQILYIKGNNVSINKPSKNMILVICPNHDIFIYTNVWGIGGDMTMKMI